MAKRLFDVLVSAGALLILGPIMLGLALAVRLDSAGPAIFRQTRVARGGRLFQMLKFRSMAGSVSATAPLITVGADPRITRVGAFLRRTKLDELPQLLNVLKGDMSLVGPRPEVPRYVAFYPPQLRELVLSVRPGITDEASIEFARESELLAGCAEPERHYVEEVLPRKLDIYARYARHHTLAGDLRILMRTLSLAARREHGTDTRTLRR
jgi:lipopolysaccharide/colanic/teichoic acid biosynthesis glycosyltransferase